MFDSRFVTSAFLLVFWLYAAITNALALYDAHQRGGSTSLVLFIGGIAGAIGLLVCPLPGVAIWAWVPPLVDVGCAPALGTIVVACLRDRRKTNGAEDSTAPHSKDNATDEA